MYEGTFESTTLYSSTEARKYNGITTFTKYESAKLLVLSYEGTYEGSILKYESTFVRKYEGTMLLATKVRKYFRTYEGTVGLVSCTKVFLYFYYYCRSTKVRKYGSTFVHR